MDLISESLLSLGLTCRTIEKQALRSSGLFSVFWRAYLALGEACNLEKLELGSSVLMSWNCITFKVEMIYLSNQISTKLLISLYILCFTVLSSVRTRSHVNWASFTKLLLRN